MGLFDSNSPFDADVEKATNENNTAEDWGIIMEICDKVGNSSSNSKECLKSITKRLQNQDPHVALQAITLLDACVNNCGKMFQLEVASRDFEGVLRKLLVGTGRSATSQTKVVEKLRAVVKTWAEGDFKSDPQLGLIPSLYHKLRQEGIDFSAPSTQASNKNDIMTTDPDAVTNQKEVEDIAKAIALSLNDSQGRSSTSSARVSSSIYPSVSTAAPAHKYKVRALYDFEAAEDNELTFFTGEIIHVTDDSDSNWWRGTNQRGEGLFPANFVTTDLTTKSEKKSVQFNETVEVKKIKAPEQVVIDEGKIDRVLNLLHEADPNDGHNDSDELLALEDEVYKMGPLIDSELEKVDRKSSDLAAVGATLVDAINMYHSLMHEPPPGPPQFKPAFPPPHLYNGYPAPFPPPGGYVPAPMDQQQPPPPHMNGAMYTLGGSPHHLGGPAPHLPGPSGPVPTHLPQQQPPQ